MRAKRRWVLVAGAFVAASQAHAAADDPGRVYSVAIGDFDGDGKPDVAVGLPEMDFGTLPHAGCVRIYSGATGALLRQTTGESAEERYGASIAAVGEVDGDGATDLAVATLGGRPPHVDFVSGKTGRLIRRVTGATQWERGYPRLCPLGDGSTSTRVDVAVRCWDKPCWRVVHSDTGAVDGFVEADWQGELPVVCSVGDVDGDGRPDLAVANWDADVGGKKGAGVVRVASGKRFRDGSKDADILVLRGSRERESFGLALAAAGDWDGDGKSDILVGVPGDSARRDSSWLVRVFSGKDGAEIWRAVGDPGDGSMSGVAMIGDADGDGRPDVAVGTRLRDDGCGAITARSAKTGALVWSAIGDPGEALGDGLFPCGDMDGDGVADLVVLAPGASRSNGAVRVLSGDTGRVIRRIDPHATRSDADVVKDATAPKNERRDAAWRLVEARVVGRDVEPILAILVEWLRDASSDRTKAIELVDRLWRTRAFDEPQTRRVERALLDVAKRGAPAGPKDADLLVEERAAALLTLELGVSDVEVRTALWTEAKDESDDALPRVNAIRALAQAGVLDVDSIPDWTVVAKSKDEDVRQCVADNLFRAKPPEFDAVLGPLQFDAKNLTRTGAIESQMKRGRPTMLARFDELMEDSYEYARFSAMLAAARFKGESDGAARRAAMILRVLESSDDPTDVTGAVLALTMIAGETFGVKPMDVHIREQDVEEKALAAFVADKAGRKKAADAWRAKLGVADVWTDAERAATLTKLLASADPENVKRAKSELARLGK
jgi:hypothetical protein